MESSGVVVVCPVLPYSFSVEAVDVGRNMFASFFVLGDRTSYSAVEVASLHT